MLYPVIETGGAWLKIIMKDMDRRLDNWRIGGLDDRI